MMKLFTSREKQRVAAERAEAEVQRQWSVSRQLRQELQQKEREAEELRGQIAIYKAEFKAAGKRPAAEEPEDEDLLRQAVNKEIKERRKQNVPPSEPISLKERRAVDRAAI